MFDLIAFVKTAGIIGVGCIVFAESGLFFGFFLPGDSLLFTAGLIASQGAIGIVPLVLVCFFAAAAGDSFGYAFGKKTGPKIFSREDSRFFRKAYLERTRAFYAAHGSKTIFLSRFIPFARTFAPILAGVGNMRYGTFLFYNLFGAAGWAALLPLLGFFLGTSFPDVDKYLLPIVGVIIALSLAPFVRERIRARRS